MDEPGKNIKMLVSARFAHISCMAVGENARNVIPSQATASFDMRLVKGNDQRRQFDRLAAHIRRQGYTVLDREPTPAERGRFARITRLDYGTGYNAERTDLDDPMVQSVRRALNAHSSPVVVPTLGGSLPLYLLRRELHAPNVVVSLWNHDNNQHAEDENIRLQNLWQGVEAVAAILVMKCPKAESNCR